VIGKNSKKKKQSLLGGGVVEVGKTDLAVSIAYLINNYHDLLYNNRPVHFIKKALRKCFRERANFRR
jgi:hypothetical protein